MMQIRNTQIMAGTITADRLSDNFNLPTNQLAEGANFLQKNGSVAMTASFNFGGFKGTNIAAPTVSSDAANKGYVDSVDAGNFKKDGSVAATGAFNLGGNRITSVADPVNPQDVATKNYVDLSAQGLTGKDAVRVATTANITLSGTQTIDGIALAIGDRVLVKAQTTFASNGIYVVASGSWSRSEDAYSGNQLKGGSFVFVQEGATQADTGWVVSTDGPINIGTTGINWVQFSSAGVILAGNGLTKSGNTLSVLVPASSGLTVNGSGVAVALDGATLTKTGTGLKLTDPGAGKIYVGNAAGAATAVSITGDATLSNSGVLTITGGLKGANFVNGETPTGAINGSNANFSLSSVPVAGSERVFYNGIRLKSGSGEDYTIAGSTITMIAFIPQSGDKVMVDYIK